MKLKIIAGCLCFLIVPLFFITFGCGGLTETLFGGGREYYPNADGNSWTYSKVTTSNTTTDVVTVTSIRTYTGIATIDSITVQKVKNETISGGNIFTTEAYQVVTDSSVKNYGDQSHPTTEAETFLVFPLMVDSEWTINGEGDIATVIDIESVTVPAGTYNDCFRIEMDSTNTITDIWLAKNVGMVKSVAVSTFGGTIFTFTTELTSKNF